MRYFGFAIADSMFTPCAELQRNPLTADDVRSILQDKDTMMILNPSHKPTIDAAVNRYGFDVYIPDRAPVVMLEKGDRLMLMSVRGLPRLEGRHEYTKEEIESAIFSFGEWVVTG